MPKSPRRADAPVQRAGGGRSGVGAALATTVATTVATTGANTVTTTAPGVPAWTWRSVLRFAGPGLLVSVGYMDPGNWATDIEAGSRYGHSLLFVVLLSSLAAMLLQALSMRLGLISRRDLARLCRDRYHPAVNIALWLLAELALVACDLAEVLGGALAMHLLFGWSLTIGVAVTALDTLLVLGLRGRGLRAVEAVVLALVLTITACFAVELALVRPDWSAVMAGFVPRLRLLHEHQALYLAVGILGATVMPHNLYLHSSIVVRRRGQSERTPAGQRNATRWCTADTVFSLTIAMLVNAAILTLAASAFHATGHDTVTEIQDAYHLLDPVVGGTLAATLFAVALLAAGQSATFTGTLAGQIVMDGFVALHMPAWARRALTRGLALIPAFVGVGLLGESGVGRLLVLSQVVLSFQLPFAIYPLIRFTSDARLMGEFRNGPWLASAAWVVFAAIVSANVWLLHNALS